MKIGLYISSQCKNKQLLNNFAQILIKGLSDQIYVCTPKNILSSSFDIIHVLSGNNIQCQKIISIANHNGIPILYSPLGIFQPWVNTFSFAIWKKRLLQKRLIDSAQIIHVWSKAEQTFLHDYTSPQKMVYIPNSIVTHNLNSEDMCCLFSKLYKKIIDTYVDMVLTPELKKDIYTLLQISLNHEKYQEPSLIVEFIAKIQEYTDEEWRRILLYSYDQEIIGYLYDALEKIKIQPPMINIQQIDRLYQTCHHIKPDTNIISTDDPIDKIYCEFRNIIRARECSCPPISNYVALYKLLCSTDYDENKLVEQLRYNHLFEKAQQLIIDMQNITGLKEGFIPTSLYTEH